MKEGFLSLIKSSYLLLVKVKAKSSRMSHDKIVYLLSFPSTSLPVLEELSAHFGNRLVICYTANCLSIAQQFQAKGNEIYPIDRFSQLMTHVIPLVKGANTVLCDNYFAFLGAVDFLPMTEVIQLWHADGAIKKFGIEANYAKRRGRADQKRYKEVYKRFTHYAVGSDKMGQIFQTSYLAKADQLLPIGYLPADQVIATQKDRQQANDFYVLFPEFKEKRILFYTPTYRETATENPLNFDQLSKELGPQWVIVAKAHPHDRELKNKLAQSTTIHSDLRGLSLQAFLPFVDCLVTDYSSVPFEYTLVKKEGEVIFFCYDMEEYREEVGIQADFEEWAPGPIVNTQEQLIQAINNKEKQNLSRFNSLWNQYNDGQATQRLIQRIEAKT